MTSQQIREQLDKGLSPEYSQEYIGSGIWQIALQLALLNEHCARTEKRYMEITAPVIERQKAKGKGQKAKGATQ